MSDTTPPPPGIREIDGEPRFLFSRTPAMDVSGADVEALDWDRRLSGGEDFNLQAVSEICRGGGGDGSCATSPAPWESTEDARKVFDKWSQSSGQHTTSQMVARHRQEMIELVAGMPESSYELSLRDMVVELHRAEGGVAVVGGGEAKGAQIGVKRLMKKDESRVAVATAMRSDYLHTGFLLRMFVPGNLGRRKRGIASGAGTQKKLPPLSPPPPALAAAAVEKDPDREWSRRTTGSESSGSGSNYSSSSNSSSSDGSTSSGGSVNHIIPRRLGGGCLLFMKQKKNKTVLEI